MNDRNVYTEKHHIIPKCKGGSNRKDNIVRLTPREHLLAHKLLARIYNDRSMWFALLVMSRKNCKSALGEQVSSREYGLIRNSMALTTPHNKGVKMSEAARKNISNSSPRLSGADHPMFGRKHTLESKIKMSKSRIGTQSGINHPLWGKGHSDETKRKFSEQRGGIGNPRHDKLERTFKNDDGKIYIGTRMNFCDTFSFGRSNGGVSRMVSKGLTYKGWKIEAGV